MLCFDMKYLFFSFFLLHLTQVSAQSTLEKIAVTGSLDSMSFTAVFPELLNHDLVFYGFIHGAEMTQQVDGKLVIELLQNGFKYYAPEVSYSAAFFLNKFLATGDETYLTYALQSYAAQQDASVQWMEKYQSIYAYNQTLPESERLTIIGTDKEGSRELRITHLAHLLPAENSGIPILDSLRKYTVLDEEWSFMSGKHVFKLANKHNCSYRSILYPKDGQYHFATRFMEYYEANTQEVLTVFAEHQHEVEQIMMSQPDGREATITKNFEARVLPLIERGEKVYSNYGYAHVLQASFDGNLYLAGSLKANHPDLKLFSILTHLAEGEVNERVKLCPTEKIKRYGKTIRLAKVCAGVSSTEWDGDTKKEAILGIAALKSMTPSGQLTAFSVADLPAAQSKKRFFIDYEPGKNVDKNELEKDKATSDYFQGVLYIEGSAANIPYELR